jgi:DNA (cytosine-5)-methyltransferase 1
MKLGSLFDGSGGFPLAGVLCGVEPVWASEIEPYPIKVTSARFPNMKHLGDVQKINGAEIEPVDIITFGSPCQDLSVAGARAGLHRGERSSLFFEAIRIIKEMREATNGKYPRFAIWENVPGAFSSNKGEDFRAVLQAFCGVCDETVSIPRPGKWLYAGAIVGDSYSVAWRTYDAQYWGVPQRRRRVYLIADFRGECAGEVLFKPESVLWHPSKSGGTWETASRTPEEGTGSTVNCVLASSAVNAEMTGGGHLAHTSFQSRDRRESASADQRGDTEWY